MPSPLQLLVDLDVELPDGRLQRAKALIDTGAEVDLVRSEFVPRQLFSPAVVQMVFIMANRSSKLSGGSLTVELCFRFSQKSVAPRSQNLLSLAKHFMRLTFMWIVF